MEQAAATIPMGLEIMAVALMEATIQVRTDRMWASLWCFIYLFPELVDWACRELRRYCIVSTLRKV